MLRLGVTIVKRIPHLSWLLRFPLLYLLRSMSRRLRRERRERLTEAPTARGKEHPGEARRRRRAGSGTRSDRLTPFGLHLGAVCAVPEGPDAGREKRPGQHPVNRARRVRYAATPPAQPGRCGGLVWASWKAGKGVRQQEGEGKGVAAQRGRGEHSQAAVPSRDRPEAAARRSRDRVRIEGRRPALDRHQVKHLSLIHISEPTRPY